MLREQVNPYAPVSWVREDLDALLSQVSKALEASAENRDTSLLAPLLTQLAGVLEILNTKGGVVAVKELEESWKAYKRGAVESQEKALSSMMQTSVVLGLYLDRLESGQKDHPMLLLPALNDLRAARGLPLLSEGSLFEPDLELGPPASIKAVKKPLSGRKQKKAFAELGEEFGDWVGHWEEDETNTRALTKMQAISRQLHSQLKKPAHRRTWWIAEAVIRGVHKSLIENTISLRHLLKRLHDLMLAMATRPGDEGTVLENDSAAKAMLYQIATAASGDPLIDELKICYQLADQVPEALAMDHSRGFLGGQSRDLFDSLGAAITTEIEALKEQLSEASEDDELPGGDSRPIDESLIQIAATLDMLNLHNTADSLQKHVPLWQEKVAAEILPDEEQMDALAEELIRVESRVAEYVATLGGGEQETARGDSEDARPFLQATFRHVMDESVGTLKTIKDGLRDWMSHAVTAGDIAENNELFIQISGALLLTEQEQVATATDRLYRFTKQLLADEQELNQPAQEAFSDAIATLELYLVSQRDQEVDNIQSLQATLLERLEFLADADNLATATPPPADKPVAQEPVQDESFLDIFLEEFTVVNTELQQKTPEWLAEPEINDLLFDIRRGYHTLKGSGHMVGAKEIGDFSWQVENLLNQVLEGNQPLSADCRYIIQVATAALPLLQQRLEGKKEALAVSAIDAIGNEAAELADGTACDFQTLAATLPAELAALLADAESDLAAEPSLDPALLELMQAEVGKHLTTLQEFRAELHAAPDSIATRAHELAAHTISGSFAQIAANDEAEIMAALEQLLEIQADAELPLPEDFSVDLAVILAIVDTRSQSLDSPSVETSHDAMAITSRLHGYISDLKDRDLAGTKSDADSQDDLVSFFLQEGGEILERCDTLLNQWREDPAAKSVVTSLQREIHTFKGSARMVGLEAMGELSHSMENTLEKIADGLLSASSKIVGLLEKGSDHLLGMLEAVKSGSGEVATETISTYIASLRQAEQGSTPAMVAGDNDEVLPVAGKEPGLPTAPQATITAAGAKHAAAKPTAKTASKPRSAAQPDKPVRVRTAKTAPATTLLKPAPGYKPIEIPDTPEILQAIREMPDVRESKKASQDTIRVPSGLLDDLVNYAGEINIFRARVEQQMSAARSNLTEIHETITRLRGQLRKMDTETENQILSRYRRESDQNAEDFDPLELDRYSTIQQLSRGLAESVSDLVNLQEMQGDTARQSESLLKQQSRVNNELQEGLMQSRMVPFATLAPRLRRVVRKAGTDTDKKARLVLQLAGGSDGQMDRNILERITAPLEHMLRNAIAHGIETPAERRKSKKPAEGVISITVENEATALVIRIEDDGVGIDLPAIRKLAVKRGLLKAREKATDSQLLNLLLESGFSTASEVTSLAGRGVGMDVVNNEIKQIGGSLGIKTTDGKGSVFTIRIPFSLAIMQAMSALVGDRPFAIPLVNVRGLAKMTQAEYKKRIRARKPVYKFAGEEFQLLEMEPLLGYPPLPLDEDTISLLMIQAGNQVAAFRVAEIYEHRELVVKAVGPQINSIPGILGGTITGNGEVMLILEMGPLIQRAIAEGIVPGAKKKAAFDSEAEATRLPLIMVVDDSITMRKVTSRVLENSDFEVITARDGLDAVEQLQERIPDLMLLDIEMPRMDGFELAEHVRADKKLKHIPLIMITSRSGQKHRDHATELGVDGYLTKPYQEAELVRNVRELLPDTGG